ncbi:poly(U)-specific 3'-to-5' RNA exonuclease [Ascosphaera aggregata]|nr:poly(U)-specific 3'-to-5' RNA exonuclease [Ascosphaera aggregata]
MFTNNAKNSCAPPISTVRCAQDHQQRRILNDEYFGDALTHLKTASYKSSYSDSESESAEDEPHEPPAKRSHQDGLITRDKESELPLLPDSFRSLYATSVRVSTCDDPSLHGGRKRIVPHTPGNWPTHLQLEWYPNSREVKLLSRAIDNAVTVTNVYSSAGDSAIKVHSLLYNDLGVRLPLHISLSRTLALTRANKDQFAESLKRGISKSGIKPFAVSANSLRWVSNYENTRWFLVLGVGRPRNDELNRLLRLSNSIVKQYAQPSLYEEETAATGSIGDTQPNLDSKRKRDILHCPKAADYTDHFHVSIAWTLQKPSDLGKERLSTVDIEAIKNIEISFSCAKARIGNNITSLYFTTGILLQESGIGFI